MADEATPASSAQAGPRQIGPGKYLLGMGVVLSVLFLSLGAFSTAMNSTSSSAESALAVPLVLIALASHIMLVIWRLRNAQRSRWLTPVFVILPFVWILISAEMVGAQTYGWIAILAGALIIYASPAVLKPANVKADS